MKEPREGDISGRTSLLLPLNSKGYEGGYRTPRHYSLLLLLLK